MRLFLPVIYLLVIAIVLMSIQRSVSALVVRRVDHRIVDMIDDPNAFHHQHHLTYQDHHYYWHKYSMLLLRKVLMAFHHCMLLFGIRRYWCDLVDAVSHISYQTNLLQAIYNKELLPVVMVMHHG